MFVWRALEEGAGSLFEEDSLPAEIEEGPFEYKRKLVNPSSSRFNKLVSHFATDLCAVLWGESRELYTANCRPSE